MADTTNLHPRMAEAYEAAAKAAVSNRTIYPVTLTTNVYHPNGTSIEDDSESGTTGSETTDTSTSETNPTNTPTSETDPTDTPTSETNPEEGSNP